MKSNLAAAEIEKLKVVLLKEDLRIKKNIKELREDDPFTNPNYSSDNAAIDTDVREQVGHDTISAQIESLQKRQSRIASALGKIESGEFGFCENCQKPISKERLEFLPEARYCIECERELVV